MIRIPMALAVAAAGAAAAMVAVPVAANAGSSLCPSAKICVYGDNNFSGLLGYRSAGLGLANVSSTNNDKMSSWENKSGTNARWYHDANGGGSCVTMLAHHEDNDINFIDDNEMSSWATNGAC